MDLKKSANGIKAPQGWLFQDNKKGKGNIASIITLVRVREKGNWKVDYKGDEIPKDFYVSAEEYMDNTWEITYLTIGGHSGYKKRGDMKEITKSVIKTARQLDKADKEWYEPKK